MTLRLAAAALAFAVACPAVTASPIAIGDKITPFKMKDAAGSEVNLASFQGKKAVVLVFIATQCPVSNAYNGRMAALARDYGAKGVAFIGINSNKQEPPAEIVEHAKANGFTFPILKDEGNRKADEVGALVTPEAYVFDAAWTLRYHGRIDDDRSGRAIRSHDLRAAVEAILAGRDVPLKEAKAFGCTIKRVAR